jgi:tRNA U34 2-thiouridine synthase MnmA/TrmU
MFSRAAQYMQAVGADFVFTGEVLGQRPMSQLRKSMKWIEEGTGLVGRLVRPLCAQLLEPTIPETEGLIDRTKMLRISGRGRNDQLKFAEQHDITDYSATGGGCLLTDHHFARRMKDTLDHGYRNFRETVALKWGRHFRINKDFKLILGRDADENSALKAYAHTDDTIMELVNSLGPTLILKGYNPSQELLAQAAGFIQMFSKYKDEETIEVNYWLASQPNEKHVIRSQKITNQTLETTKI